MGKEIVKTLRMDSDIDTILREEARSKRISINKLVNTIIEDYIILEKKADHYGLMRVLPRTLQAFLNPISDEEIAKIGRELGGTNYKEVYPMLGYEDNLESLFNLLLISMPLLGRWYKIVFEESNGVSIFNLKHKLSKKWSILLSEYIRTFLKSKGIKEKDSPIIEERNVILSFYLSKSYYEDVKAK
jgi:hypothetical protein